MASKLEIERKAEEQRQSMVEQANRERQFALRKAINDERNQRNALFEKEMADKISVILQGGKIQDGSGRTVTLWEEAVNAANRAIGQEQNTYHDLRAAYMALVSIYSVFVDAAQQSEKEMIAPYTEQIKHLARVKLYQVKDSLVDKLNGEPKIEVPTFFHNVSMNDENKIESSVRSTYDFEDAEGFDAAIESLTALWLLDNNYKPQQLPESASAADKKAALGCYVHVVSGEVLTKAQFEELKNSEEHGFDKFLNTSAEHMLHFEEDHTPTSRPSVGR